MMKKMLLTAAMLVSAWAANAQETVDVCQGKS